MDLRRNRANVNRSPRHLALRHGHRLLRTLNAASSDAPPALQPGQEQLFSFYRPGLEAGLHQIDVVQDINARPKKTPVDPKDVKTVTTSHQFNVVAPRFSLPSGAIYSYYPPDGHEDRGEVLPSVLFTDPTLPWERIASWKSEKNHPPDYDHNAVPWLAVLLFTQDELRLSADDLSAIFATTSIKDKAQQNGTFAVTMPASDASQTSKTATAIMYDPTTDGKDAQTDAIFLRASLFNSIFTKYDENGNPDPTQTNGEVYAHRYLAHLRHIHFDGGAGAGETDDDDHAFSVVVCHRAGPLAVAQPTTVVAHLVNIEGVEAMSFPVKQDFVSMSSLHSWQYICLPSNSLNVGDAFAHLGAGVDVLKPEPNDDDRTLLNGHGQLGARLGRRLTDGYSMVKYRVQTGEITAAFVRSPSAACTVNFPDPKPGEVETDPWPPTSTTGTKLQILDQELGIMDITYSVAWQLGKTLALADETFSIALSRVRKQIFDLAMKNAQLSAHQTQADAFGTKAVFKTKEGVLKTLATTIQKIGELTRSNVLATRPNGMVQRWSREHPPTLSLSYASSEIDPIIDEFLQKAALKIASSTDGEDIPYNEYNTPYSTDWMLVLQWVLNRYYLVDVPPHYLITDPSHVPLESLRMFQIDSAWVAAMIDGGLSLANHLDQNDDRIRRAIKTAINKYLSTTIKQLNYVPPIPRYGFFVRSALVTKFPDMVVDLRPPPDPTKSPVILRHEVVDTSTMLCLLREAPIAPDFKSLLLREPPHQQFFAAATEIDPKQFEVSYKKVYTDPTAKDPEKDIPIDATFTRGGDPSTRPGRFIWGSTPQSNDVRILNTEFFATDLYTTIKKTLNTPDHPNWYTEPFPTSALMGIQLNEPCWQLEIALPDKTAVPKLVQSSAQPVLSTSSNKAPAAPPVHSFQRRQLDATAHPEFGNRTRADLSPPKHVPPHYRFPTMMAVKTGGTVDDTPPADAPVFAYNVYPVGGSPQTGVPMLKGPQDLIFSIVYVKSAQNFQMEGLEIHIPFDSPAHLIQNYRGTKPVMLSNLRFNVINQYNQANEMVITLKPRSLTKVVPVTRIAEMSFMLSGVTVPTYNNPTPLILDVFEKYKFRDRFPNTMTVYLNPVPSSTSS